MKLRDPASAPKSGERVGFVVVSDKDAEAAIAELGGCEPLGLDPLPRPGKKTLLFTKAEDPGYVQAHRDRIEIDANYYVTRLRNPVFKLVESFLSAPRKKQLNELFSLKRDQEEEEEEEE
ncbi:hypothetical protein M8J77_001131 [Diaphorina citri]|nr:hypothetical protein M8J77_001131 [Diaphorina citri]